MATSRNCSLLYWAWYGWRESVANQQARDDFAEYVTLLNEGSRNQGNGLLNVKHFANFFFQNKIDRSCNTSF